MHTLAIYCRMLFFDNFSLFSFFVFFSWENNIFMPIFDFLKSWHGKC